MHSTELKTLVWSFALVSLGWLGQALLGSGTAWAGNSEARELDWLELMPAEDRAAIEAMPEITHDSLDFPAVFRSEKIVAELDGERIKIPGFVVPIQFEQDMRVTEFFLVPYFGACIHVPPPPPNQILYVRFPRGIKIASIAAPYWVTGELSVETTQHQIAKASYSLAADAMQEYQEEY